MTPRTCLALLVILALAPALLAETFVTEPGPHRHDMDGCVVPDGDPQLQLAAFDSNEGEKILCRKVQEGMAAAFVRHYLDTHQWLVGADMGTLGLLTEEHYLPAMPEDPGDGPNSFFRFSLRGPVSVPEGWKVGLRCERHGDVGVAILWPPAKPGRVTASWLGVFGDW